MAKLPITTPRIEPTPGPLMRVINIQEPIGRRTFDFLGEGIEHEQLLKKGTGEIGICPIASGMGITRQGSTAKTNQKTHGER
jgi:hypothetical protein